MGGWVRTGAQVMVIEALTQILDPLLCFFFDIYSTASAGAFLSQGPVTVISLHLPPSRVLP